jgi:hypothetical protein
MDPTKSLLYSNDKTSLFLLAMDIDLYHPNMKIILIPPIIITIPLITDNIAAIGTLL